MRQPLYHVLGLAWLVGLTGCARYQPMTLSPGQTAAAFERRDLNEAGLRELITRHAATSPAVWPLEEWDLDTLTLAAFYFHPDLELARAQWRVAWGAVLTAGGRPNPTVSVAPEYNLNPARAVSPWIPTVAIDLPIETAGKRGHRVAQARHLCEAARCKIASTAFRVRKNLRSALLDWAYADRRIELLQNQSLAQASVTQLLEQRLAAGAVSAAELTPARAALLKIGLDLAEAQRQERESRGRIAAAVGVPLPAIQRATIRFDWAVPADVGNGQKAHQARQQALLGRPDLLGALADYAAAQSALQLEIARQYPDIHLGTGYQWDQGENKWSLGLGVEVPLLNRNEGPIAQAEARRAEAAARFLAMQAEVILEIDSARVRLAAAGAQLERASEWMRMQRLQLASIQARHQAGAAGLLDLQLARLETQGAALGRLDALVGVQQAIGQVEGALQQPLQFPYAVEPGQVPHVR